MPNGAGVRILTKFLTSLLQFRDQYGYWPTTLRVPEAWHHDILLSFSPATLRTEYLELIIDKNCWFVAGGPNDETWELDLSSDYPHPDFKEALDRFTRPPNEKSD